jgi:hypothetical protein
MTSETKLSGLVDRKKFHIVRMIDGRSMAVFAFDRRMARRIEHCQVFFVTLSTGLPALVLHRKVLPFLNIAQTMIAVGKATAMNTEIIWDHKLSGNEDCTDQSNRQPQWAQHMPLHRRLLSRSNGTDKVNERSKRR